MRVPKYAHHKPSNRARVRINGDDHFLGRWNSPESKRKYRALIAEWRNAINAKASGLRPDLTIRQLAGEYLPFAESHYRKNDRVTSEVSCITSVLRVLVETCGALNADDFGPLRLEETRDAMIAAGWERKSINKQVGRIRRLFKWAASRQLIRGEIYRDLETLQGLQKGRCQAIEGEPVKPVPSEHLDHVRRVVSTPVRALIDLQLACGCRPGEATIMRG
jgi:integrase